MQDNKTLQSILRKFTKCFNATYEDRLMAIQDRRFCSIAGAQWEGAYADFMEHKPQIEINKVQGFVNKIISEYKNSSIDIYFKNGFGSSDDVVAEACNDMYRYSNNLASTQEAFDNAFSEAVQGGLGAILLRVDEDEEIDDQYTVVFEPIYDADISVFFDINSQKYDKSDARYCFVVRAIDSDLALELYGHVPASISTGYYAKRYDRRLCDVVYIADYYEIEDIEVNSITLSNIMGDEFEDIVITDADEEKEEYIRELKELGYEPTKSKKTTITKCTKQTISGDKVLEDCGYIAGGKIPVVPVFGKRFYIDSIERISGAVRIAKDAQRLLNMTASNVAEIASCSMLEKPIVTHEQMIGNEKIWAMSNEKRMAYLTLNTLQDISGNPILSGPVAYTKSPAIPPALAALSQIADSGIRDVFGNAQEGEKIVSNISADAIDLVQQKIDMQSYGYIANYAKSLKRCGELWVAMIQEICSDPEVVIRRQKEDGSIEFEKMKNVAQRSGLYFDVVNILSKSKINVQVEVGPTSASKQNGALRSIMQLISVTKDPQTASVLEMLAVLNMTGDGISDAKNFFRKKLVFAGVLDPNEQEKQEILAAQQAQQQNDANSAFLKASAENAEAQAVKARADTVLTMAKAKQTNALTAKTISEISKNDLDILKSIV